jgi:hypothetical protein
VISEAHGIAGVFFLLSRNGQWCESLCRQPGPQIDNRLFAEIAASAPASEKRQIAHGIARCPGENEARDKEPH